MIGYDYYQEGIQLHIYRGHSKPDLVTYTEGGVKISKPA
jgi:hypothetical protein